MNFFSSIVNRVSESLSSSASFTAVEVNRSTISQYEVVASDDQCKLYKAIVGRDIRYCFVLTIPGSVPKYIRLFQLGCQEDALSLFSLYSARVVPIVSVCKSIASVTNRIQDVCNKVRQDKSDSIVHVCVKLGLLEVLKRRHPQIVRNVNALNDTNSSSLHIACLNADVNADMVNELVRLGADVTLRDSHGYTALHHASKYSPTKLKALLSCPTEAVNCMNIYGETPVHIACTERQTECLELLLASGANPTVSESYKLPIHCAVKSNSTECVKLLVSKYPQLRTGTDGKFGGTALHWAKTKQMVECLLECGVPADALSNTKDTALHIMLKADRRDCVNNLLTGGADVTIPNHEGLTCLHIAISTDDLAMVRSLVVFGADVNMVDRNGNSPRHITATKPSKDSGKILYTLHLVGSYRCAAERSGCNEGCSAAGTFNGTKVSDINTNRLHIDEEFEDMMGRFHEREMPMDGYRVLCLDGGGIRGLILSMMLIQLEKISGVDIRDSFDWISGTSTGGILALALTSGKSGRYCLGLYFKLKNKVFCGSKPYKSEVFEKILKEEFGQDTLMADLPYPRVLVTSVLADRFPPDLHLFRNYENPLHQNLTKEVNDKHPAPPKPNEVYVWQAARSSGAAPTFFTASMNRFLDGGLMANNPTIDTLTEIQEFNTGLKLMNQHAEVKPIKCVVSLGTGRPPQTPVNDIDVYRPMGIMEAYKVVQGATALLKLLVEQATQSEGRPTERARAWCSMINAPFFRLSPQLSIDVVLDETDDDKLLLVCWETMVYLHQNQERLVRIANILNQSTPRRL